MATDAEEAGDRQQEPSLVSARQTGSIEARGENVRTTILKSTLALGAIAVACVAATSASAHSTAPAAAKANVDVCVLLPDTKSSVRWELFDRPYLNAAF